jgi:hypothetical protein
MIVKWDFLGVRNLAFAVGLLSYRIEETKNSSRE